MEYPTLLRLKHDPFGSPVVDVVAICSLRPKATDLFLASDQLRSPLVCVVHLDAHARCHKTTSIGLPNLVPSLQRECDANPIPRNVLSREFPNQVDVSKDAKSIEHDLPNPVVPIDHEWLLRLSLIHI